MNGELDEKVYEVQTVLEKMCPGRVNLTKNLMADRWSKVMINATFSGMSTVCADTFYYVIHTERALTCAVRIGRECIRVCHAMGITLPSYLGWISTNFLITTTLLVRMQLLLLFKRFSVPFRVLMLQDLEKGRKCEIRFIDGVVSDEGKKLGILTPYTDAVVAIVLKSKIRKRPR